MDLGGGALANEGSIEMWGGVVEDMITALVMPPRQSKSCGVEDIVSVLVGLPFLPSTWSHCHSTA